MGSQGDWRRAHARQSVHEREPWMVSWLFCMDAIASRYSLRVARRALRRQLSDRNFSVACLPGRFCPFPGCGLETHGLPSLVKRQTRRVRQAQLGTLTQSQTGRLTCHQRWLPQGTLAIPQRQLSQIKSQNNTETANNARGTLSQQRQNL